MIVHDSIIDLIYRRTFQDDMKGLFLFAGLAVGAKTAETQQ